MPDKKVHVYEVSSNEYRIEPPLVELDVSSGDILKIKNHSKDDLVVYVGTGAFHATDPAVKALKGKDLIAFPVPVVQTTSGTMYTYQIINPKTGAKAKANSDPVLIVEN